MALVADSGGLYALYDADDAHHEATVRVVAAERGALLIPVVVLGEVDYLLREFLGISPRRRLRQLTAASAVARARRPRGLRSP